MSSANGPITGTYDTTVKHSAALHIMDKRHRNVTSRGETHVSEWTIAGIVMAAAGLVMIGLGKPLVEGKVGRNKLYGYRSHATLRDDRVWYPVNALSGIWLIWAGFLSLAIGVLLLIFRNNEDAAQLVIVIGIPALIICLIVGVYRGWKLARAIDEQIDEVDRIRQGPPDQGEFD